MTLAEAVVAVAAAGPIGPKAEGLEQMSPAALGAVEILGHGLAGVPGCGWGFGGGLWGLGLGLQQAIGEGIGPLEPI